MDSARCPKCKTALNEYQGDDFSEILVQEHEGPASSEPSLEPKSCDLSKEGGSRPQAQLQDQLQADSERAHEPIQMTEEDILENAVR